MQRCILIYYVDLWVRGYIMVWIMLRVAYLGLRIQPLVVKVFCWFWHRIRVNISLVSLQSIFLRFYVFRIMISFSKLLIVILTLRSTAQSANIRPKQLSPNQRRMKQDWENTEEHPPLNRTEAEHYFLNRVLYKAADWNDEYYYDYEGFQPRSEGPTCLRKEYRTLSESSRRQLHEALNIMKTTVVDSNANENRTEYDVFVGYHRFDVANGAHYGPAFLAWHREYLLR